MFFYSLPYTIILRNLHRDFCTKGNRKPAIRQANGIPYGSGIDAPAIGGIKNQKELIMKKFFVLALLVVLAISCVAVEARDLTIAFSQIGQESDWRTANTDSVNGTL